MIAGTIHPATHIRTVALTVTNLERSLAFYQNLIGLRLHQRTAQTAHLGVGGPDLLILHEQPAYRRYRGVCELYHVAILVPNRYELARALARLFRARYPNAPTDHIMTKAIYLDDPEGNGIEIYCESPEDGVFVMNNDIFFARRVDGSLSNGREPLDVAALLRLLSPTDDLAAPMAATTSIGHIHLHVADIDVAVDFYHRLIGFDIQGVIRRFQMAMVSAGGYHHHIGLNTWQGEGAPSAPPDALGLQWFSIVVPDQSTLAPILDRLRDAGITEEAHPAGRLLHDPFHNRIVLTTREQFLASASHSSNLT